MDDVVLDRKIQHWRIHNRFVGIAIQSGEPVSGNILQDQHGGGTTGLCNCNVTIKSTGANVLMVQMVIKKNLDVYICISYKCGFVYSYQKDQFLEQGKYNSEFLSA